MFGKNRLQYIDIKTLVVMDCNVSKPYHRLYLFELGLGNDLRIFQ